MSKVRLSMNVVNSSASEITVHIEPWGVQNRVSRGDRYEFYIEGPNDETLEVEYGENKIIFYGWDESTTSARSEHE